MQLRVWFDYDEDGCEMYNADKVKTLGIGYLTRPKKILILNLMDKHPAKLIIILVLIFHVVVT